MSTPADVKKEAIASKASCATCANFADYFNTVTFLQFSQRGLLFGRENLPQPEAKQSAAATALLQTDLSHRLSPSPGSSFSPVIVVHPCLH